MGMSYTQCVRALLRLVPVLYESPRKRNMRGYIEWVGGTLVQRGVEFIQLFYHIYDYDMSSGLEGKRRRRVAFLYIWYGIWKDWSLV